MSVLASIPSRRGVQHILLAGVLGAAPVRRSCVVSGGEDRRCSTSERLKQTILKVRRESEGVGEGGAWGGHRGREGGGGSEVGHRATTSTSPGQNSVCSARGEAGPVTGQLRTRLHLAKLSTCPRGTRQLAVISVPPEPSCVWCSESGAGRVTMTSVVRAAPSVVGRGRIKRVLRHEQKGKEEKKQEQLGGQGR